MQKVLAWALLLLALWGPARAEEPHALKKRMVAACHKLEPEERRLKCHGYVLVMFRNRDLKSWDIMAYWLYQVRQVAPEVLVEWNIPDPDT